jgi:NADH-quinone oxidoreductase subunit A
LLAVGIIFMLILTTISSVLRPNNPSPGKLATYESGVDPVGTGWSQTYIRYYIFGLLFVIFDVEAVFIFPWAINLEKLGYFGLIEMLVFIFILLIGLVYAIRKDVLKWE